MQLGRLLAVLLLLLVAGCVGAPPSGETGGDLALEGETPAATATTAVPAAEPTASGSSAAEASDGPWDGETVRVAVVSNASDRAFRPLLARALRYWEREAPRRAGYDLRYELVDGGDDADVHVRFVERIDACGGVRDDHTAGCADYVPPGGAAPSPTNVRIETGYNDSATVSLLKHEFGHTLGLTHEDGETLPFMNATTKLGTLDRPDVGERGYHWRASTLAVHVDYGGVDGDGDYAAAVTGVLDRYERSDALPSGFAFESAGDATGADVSIRFDSAAAGEERSNATYRYVDADYDGEPEYYTRYEIVLGGVDPDRAGDLVGWYLALALYADGPSEVPDRYS